MPAGPPLKQLPSGMIPMGEVLATAGLISSGSLGDIRLAWHEFTASRFGDSTMAAVKYDISILPFEYFLGVAAPQIALPGRAALVRSFLLQFMVFSDTTTSLSPASMETVDVGGIKGGYPAWIINEMIKLDIDPEALGSHISSPVQRHSRTVEFLKASSIAAMAPPSNG